ncbi:hypothetical protein GH714_026995 [Hevea brasiliensis]|uniref:Uncharacterized protein n=1 Tax=Hevea brasiliensis TaxID=3981 RepID=A0A6A6M476_HEVBR|nr:hypothetical protein GH714_026995 [Hevea brasiliensis]
MGEESDHVHITALSDALGVPIQIVYLDRSSCDTGGVSVNHHDFIPAADDLQNSTSGSSATKIPFITLLYRPGHYDILYTNTKRFLTYPGAMKVESDSWQEPSVLRQRPKLICFMLSLVKKNVQMLLSSFEWGHSARLLEKMGTIISFNSWIISVKLLC